MFQLYLADKAILLNGNVSGNVNEIHAESARNHRGARSVAAAARAGIQTAVVAVDDADLSRHLAHVEKHRCSTTTSTSPAVLKRCRRRERLRCS